MKDVKNITLGFTSKNEVSWEDVQNCETLIVSGMDEQNIPFKIQFSIPPLPITHNFKECKRKNSILSNAKCDSCSLTIGQVYRISIIRYDINVKCTTIWTNDDSNNACSGN